MSKNLTYFFAAFLFSLPLWLGVNVFERSFEDFLFFGYYYQTSPEVFSANISQLQREVQKEVPEINAVSAISVKINNNGSKNILFEKNADQVLPIASLSKLMTAVVTMNTYDLSQEVEITKEAIEQPEDFGNLKVGEKLSAENLLYLSLIESSNDSAFSLSEQIGKEGFVDLMNLEAERLKLFGTHFTDPTGYSPENLSTAKDLVILAEYITKEKETIWEISSFLEFNLYTPDGIFHHQLSSTNELLIEYPEIIGGKTGYTNEAGGCIILILKNAKGEIIINVILNSIDRFGEMKKLIDYAI